MAEWLGVDSTKAAWQASVQTSSQRLMLLAIARYADGDGKSFPSVETLCADTKLNPKTAYKVIGELKALGVVTVEKRLVRNGNAYTVIGTTENGTTNIGTTNIGTTKTGTTENGTTNIGTTNIGTTKTGTTENGTTNIGCSSTTKNGSPVLPKTVDEYKQEETNEKRKGKKAVSVSRPDDVDPQVWADWLRVRAAKRSPLTPTAWKRIETEAKQARRSLQYVIQKCAERGWVSYKAEWDRDEQKDNPFAVPPENPFAATPSKRARRQDDEYDADLLAMVGGRA